MSGKGLVLAQDHCEAHRCTGDAKVRSFPSSNQCHALCARSSAHGRGQKFLPRDRSDNERARAHLSGWLIIALLAAVPLRKRTFAALTINQHLVKIGSGWLLDIPASDTKSRRALEFPIPDTLFEAIDLYLAKFRTQITGADRHQGLWPSAKGYPMSGGTIYDAVRRRTFERLGVPVNLHRFRSAAGNLWSISDPMNVRGAKDLLGHADFGTTERHYIGAQSRLAGRALAKVLRSPRQ